jgi:hypothetical protein
MQEQGDTVLSELLSQESLISAKTPAFQMFFLKDTCIHTETIALHFSLEIMVAVHLNLFRNKATKISSCYPISFSNHILTLFSLLIVYLLFQAMMRGWG